MKVFVGIALIFLGIALGLYVGLYVCLYGGIVSIIAGAQIGAAGVIAWGIIKILFASVAGGLTTALTMAVAAAFLER
jgi:hypothetical protein